VGKDFGDILIFTEELSILKILAKIEILNH
jgi:hypothetical protein